VIRLRQLLYAFSPVIVLSACDGTAPVGSRELLPASNFTNGPASPGPYIVRIENSLSRVITTDPEDNLIAIHGKVSGLSECTNTSTRVPVDIQIVNTPSTAQGMAFFLTGTDNDVAIYGEGSVADLNPFDPDKFCPFIENTTPLYTGTVQYRLHRNGQGSLLFQWVGELTRTSDGATVHYVEKQYAIPKDGALEFIIEDIAIH
jgi:hypothetical protein